MSNLYQLSIEKTASSWLAAMITDPDIKGLTLFCAVGLFTSLYVMLRFPDFAVLIAQCNQF